MVANTYKTHSQERFFKRSVTNLFGPIKLSRSILPHLHVKSDGILICIGFQTGWHGDPSAPVCCGSKVALDRAVILASPITH